MKSLLLSTTLLATSFLASAQLNWLSSNEPVIGDSTKYYLIDSTITNYSQITGANVTWDYSAASTYSNTNLRMSANTASSASPYASYFPSATNETFTEGHTHDFYSISSTEKRSHGMQITEDTQGDFLITYDPKKTKSYPWTYLSEVSGNLVNAEAVLDPGSGSPATYAATGKFKVKCDGHGTLKIGDSIITDVLRNYVYDSVRATIFITNVTLVSRQYEYYHASSPFPIFIHASIGVHGATLDTDYSLVLSQISPERITGIAQNQKIDIRLKVWPNPAKDVINISTSNDITIDQLNLYDAMGKLHKTAVNPGITGQFDWNIADLRAGNYILQMVTKQGVVTEKITVLP